MSKLKQVLNQRFPESVTTIKLESPGFYDRKVLERLIEEIEMKAMMAKTGLEEISLSDNILFECVKNTLELDKYLDEEDDNDGADPS